MKKVKKQDITNVLSQWQRGFTVFVPSRGPGVTEMAAWDGQDTGFLDWYRNTVIPPKNNFLLNMEKLFGFQKGDEGYRLELPPPAEREQLIFGIRPCDARAMAIIDMVFRDTYEDTYYLNKRKNTLLVGIGCVNPYDSCFCTSLGLGPMEAADVDLMLVDTGDEFLIEEVTDRGKELLAKTEGLAEATQDYEAKAAAARDTAYNKVTRKIDTGEIGQNLPLAFENKEFWEKTSAKCVSCGICTFLCPTCYCFDINDEKDARYRNWDCCSFPVYTQMPMENPREEKWRRVRQKVSHKYTFYPTLFDIIACTGCGRCIRMCPVNWDITQTLSSVPAGAGTESQHGD
ncbi:4Fe-4S dicluster domain-containing protein [Chloroflexota bacterium]